ncbi:Rhs element Vgr protein [Variovorax beijingensis]|uniref:Rhs element Vgr protein n=2 Tax=Variovorax beijingensis TaxID=2496117 RepID=A0A561CBB4_9BURK|nr:Rhs element Vgr protein [Variovorax beijingensis]
MSMFDRASPFARARGSSASMRRRVILHSRLGDALQFHRLAGREALSQAYAFDLELLGSSNAIDAKALLGKTATVVMETESGAPRYLAGLVTRFGLSHEDDRQAFYGMRLRPWLWLATRRSDFRIFQDQTVPEIVAAVLGRYGHPMEQKLHRSYRPWTYCVQYHEDDFSFVSRLCEQGIYYHFRHEAQPTSYAWRPQRSTPKPRTRGPQTAMVVGPAGEEIWTDRYGRIKVQFHWDRLGQHNEHSSCWVRVSTSWAGATFGAAALPRIGQEVIVDFLSGDPDHPIVTGRVHNADEMPAWALPSQKQLTGIRSRELGGGRSNHLALDDSSGKVQAQLKSDHQSSSLSLGHVGRIEDTAGRKDDRGQGFELRTDGHGAVRSAKGLLLSTEARANAQGHITDMRETVARLTQGRDLHESLAQVAQQAQAHEAGDQDEVARALKAQNDAIKGSGGRPGQGEFPEFQEPHLTLASPAGIQATTAASTHLVSVEHTALTSGAHTSVATGNSFLVSAKDAVRMVAFNNGIRMAAAAADIDLTALRDSINALAKLDIKMEANRITITAKEEVLVNGGSSYTRWTAGGIESGTLGLWRAHAASHSMVGPKSVPVPSIELKLPNLDLGPYKADYQLFKTDNRPFEGYAYEIHDQQRKLLESGDTSKAGQTRLVNSEMAIGLKGYKSIMRESERVTENWSSVLEARAGQAEARSAPAPGSAPGGEAA